MVLELVRPWRFPIRELPFEQKEHQEQEQQQQQQQQQGEKVAKKSSFSMGFRSYIREFFGAVLELSCFRGTVFSPRQVIFSKLFYCSRRQQELSKKSSFSMDFRRDIRQFFGVVLELVRPWRFPIRELPFEQKEHQEQEQQQQQQQKEKVAKKSSFSMGFRSYIREFFGAVLELVRPSEARCFPPGR